MKDGRTAMTKLLLEHGANAAAVGHGQIAPEPGTHQEMIGQIPATTSGRTGSRAVLRRRRRIGRRRGVFHYYPLVHYGRVLFPDPVPRGLSS